MTRVRHPRCSRKLAVASPRKARRFVPGLDYVLEARTSTTSLFYLQPGASGIGTPLSAVSITAIGTAGVFYTTGQADGVTSTDTGADQLTDVGPNRFTGGFNFQEDADATANVAAPSQAYSSGGSATGTSSITIAITHETSTVATNDNAFPATPPAANSASNTWSGDFGTGTPPGANVAPMGFTVSSNSPTSTVTATFNASVTGTTNNTYVDGAALILTSPFMSVFINANGPGGQGGPGLNVYDGSGTLLEADAGFGNNDAADSTSIQDHTALGATTLNFNVSYFSQFGTALNAPGIVAPGGSVGGSGAFSWTFQFTASD
jgi:hypothetical protein